MTFIHKPATLTISFAASALIILTLFTSISSSTALQKCVPYSGNVCTKFKRRGIPRTYLLSDDKTQDGLDQEITNILNSHQFKYKACVRYVTYLLCSQKLQPCKRKICKDSCITVKKSICFKNLDKSSKLQKWINDEFKCENVQYESCKGLTERYDYEILELSCKMEDTKREEKVHAIPSISNFQLTAKKVIRLIPLPFNGNTKCCVGEFKIGSIIKGNIISLKNLIGADDLKERIAKRYCTNSGTKTTIVPVGELSEYSPSDINKTLKNVKIMLIQRDDENAFLSILGEESICIDIGNFKYMVYPENGNNIYVGQSTKGFKWKWVDQAENNLNGDNDHVRGLMGRMRILNLFTLQKPTQVIASSDDGSSQNYRLFIDKKSSLNGLENIQSHIVIGGKSSQKSAVFHLKFTAGMDIVNVGGFLMNENIFNSLGELLNFENLKKYLLFGQAEFFFQMKNSKMNLPSSKYFLDIKHLLNKHREDAIAVKVNGEISQSTQKPSWLDTVGFKLKYKLRHDYKEEYRFEMQTLLSDDACKTKTKEQWSQFDYLLRKMDYWQKLSERDGVKITRKNIGCTVCCDEDVFTLKTISVKDLSRVFTANITIVVLNKDVEITFFAKDYNLLSGFADDEGVKKITRKYLF